MPDDESWSVENTRKIKEGYDKDVCERNLKYLRKYGTKINSTRGTTPAECNLMKVYFRQLIVELLRRSGITQNNGEPYTVLPKGFIEQARLWLEVRGFRLIGWPRDLPPTGRYGESNGIIYWPIPTIISLSILLMDGRIRIMRTKSQHRQDGLGFDPSYEIRIPPKPEAIRRFEEEQKYGIGANKLSRIGACTNGQGLKPRKKHVTVRRPGRTRVVLMPSKKARNAKLVENTNCGASGGGDEEGDGEDICDDEEHMPQEPNPSASSSGFTQTSFISKSSGDSNLNTGTGSSINSPWKDFGRGSDIPPMEVDDSDVVTVKTYPEPSSRPTCSPHSNPSRPKTLPVARTQAPPPSKSPQARPNRNFVDLTIPRDTPISLNSGILTKDRTKPTPYPPHNLNFDPCHNNNAISSNNLRLPRSSSPRPRPSPRLRLKHKKHNDNDSRPKTYAEWNRQSQASTWNMDQSLFELPAGFEPVPPLTFGTISSRGGFGTRFSGS